MSCHPPPPPAGYYQHQHQTCTIKPLLHSNLHHKSSSLQEPLLVNQFLYQLLLLLQPWSEHFWHFDLTTTKSVRELTILNEHELTIFTWFFRWPIIFFTIYSTPSSSLSCRTFRFLVHTLVAEKKYIEFFDICYNHSCVTFHSYSYIFGAPCIVNVVSIF